MWKGVSSDLKQSLLLATRCQPVVEKRLETVRLRKLRKLRPEDVKDDFESIGRRRVLLDGDDDDDDDANDDGNASTAATICLCRGDNACDDDDLFGEKDDSSVAISRCTTTWSF